jgi:hypothetical protein
VIAHRVEIRLERPCAFGRRLLARQLVEIVCGVTEVRADIDRALSVP